MFFNVFYKSEKTCFLCFYLQINVFNIYVVIIIIIITYRHCGSHLSAIFAQFRRDVENRKSKKILRGQGQSSRSKLSY